MRAVTAGDRRYDRVLLLSDRLTIAPGRHTANR
jgi:hypothetical protein